MKFLSLFRYSLLSPLAVILFHTSFAGDAGYKGQAALPAHYGITIADLEGALKKQNTKLQPGDVVLIRTGSIQYWDDLADREKLTAHDTAGPTLETIKWLVEENGAMLNGNDNSGMEQTPAPDKMPEVLATYNSAFPAHNYLLIHQGVHIGELHYLEDLAADKAYEFAYVCTTNKIQGTTAGFTLRPMVLR